MSTTATSLSPDTSHREGAPWSVHDGAKFLTVSHRHLVRLIEGGKVKSIRFGRRVLIADAEIRRLASEGVN